MLNGKAFNSFNDSFKKWIDKKRHSINKWIFFKTDISAGKCGIELDLSNYVTIANLNNATGVDTSKFAEKDDLASLKSELDKLDTGKLETTPVDFSKLSDAVKNELVKNDCIWWIS